jgi:hypothetical protein
MDDFLKKWKTDKKKAKNPVKVDERYKKSLDEKGLIRYNM